MKYVLHKANTRGHAHYGWLDTYYSFSFADYYNPERMNFGVLRVLNDDTIAGGGGFSTHSHNNMEIITIPLKGELEHKDSMGNTGVIGNNEVQVMSAGTGIYHSEYNKNQDKSINLLQIWIFPKTKNVEPRYEQKMFSPKDRYNTLQQIVSPFSKNGELWIHQDAWMYLGSFDKEIVTSYKIKKEGNGIYVFVINGSIFFDRQELKERDAAGISDTSSISFSTAKNTEVLLLDVPMTDKEHSYAN